jgi:hypothetical protein
LIKLDAPSQALNAPWGTPPKPVVNFDIKKDFPGLGKPTIPNIMDQPAVVASNALDKKETLFPNSPAAVAPPAELLAGMSINPKKSGLYTSDPTIYMNPFDPGHPKFNVLAYFVPFSKKFKCPYPGCK